MVPMETEVDMEVEAGGVHDNGLLWESKKEKGKVIHIQPLVIYHFNTFINIGQQKEKNKYCKFYSGLLKVSSQFGRLCWIIR